MVMPYGPPVTDPAALRAPTLNVYAPAEFGVPERTPVPLSRERPGGSVPDEMEKLGVGVPVAVKVKVYAWPTKAADGGAPEVSVGTSLILIVIGELTSCPALFVAVIWKVKVPTSVG